MTKHGNVKARRRVLSGANLVPRQQPELLSYTSFSFDSPDWTPERVAQDMLHTAWMHTNYFWHIPMIHGALTIYKLLGKEPPLPPDAQNAAKPVIRKRTITK